MTVHCVINVTSSSTVALVASASATSSGPSKGGRLSAADKASASTLARTSGKEVPVDGATTS
jgi:hypothetical protein